MIAKHRVGKALSSAKTELPWSASGKNVESTARNTQVVLMVGCGVRSDKYHSPLNLGAAP